MCSGFVLEISRFGVGEDSWISGFPTWRLVLTL